MNKPYYIKDNTLIDQYKLNAIVSLEAKKKSILTKSMLEKIEKALSKEDYKKFLLLSKKVSYQELEEIFYEIFRKRCVQKEC